MVKGWQCCHAPLRTHGVHLRSCRLPALLISLHAFVRVSPYQYWPPTCSPIPDPCHRRASRASSSLNSCAGAAGGILQTRTAGAWRERSWSRKPAAPLLGQSPSTTCSPHDSQACQRRHLGFTDSARLPVRQTVCQPSPCGAVRLLQASASSFFTTNRVQEMFDGAHACKEGRVPAARAAQPHGQAAGHVAPCGCSCQAWCVRKTEVCMKVAAAACMPRSSSVRTRPSCMGSKVCSRPPSA